MRRRALLGLAAAGLVGGVSACTSADEPPPAPSVGPPLARTVVWGAFADPEPWPSCQAHFDLEAELGQSLPCMSWFVNWSQAFPAASTVAKAKGYELLIAWMPILYHGLPVPFASILAGEHDDYILTFLRSCRSYGRPVTLRFAHEMNLDGHGWSVGAGGPSSPTEFVEVWRYIYRLHLRVPSSNTQLLWCISNSSGRYPATDFFPGTEYIEKVGFDGYSGFTSTGWTSPHDMISPSYRLLRSLAPAAPIWLCETGCRETGLNESDHHSKARWLSSLFQATGFPKLSHVVFFSKAKSQDWRLDSSPAALAAVREGLQSR